MNTSKNSGIDSFLIALHNNPSIDPHKKSQLADSIFQLSTRLNLPCQQLRSRIEQSYSLDEIGLSDSALVQLLWVNSNLQSKCGPEIQWMLFNGLTYVYLTLGENQKVDSLTAITRAAGKYSGDEPNWILGILMNGAIALAYEGKMEEATQLLHYILAESRRLNEPKFVQKSLVNLATIKGNIEDQDSFYYYLELAAANLRSTGEKDTYMSLQINLAVMDMDNKHYERAILRLDSVDMMERGSNNLQIRADVLYNRASVAGRQQQFKKAYDFLDKYITVHDSVLNQDRVKAVTEMQEKYESVKKTNQIQKLQVENLDATLQNERVRAARNRYLYLGGGLLLLAIGIYSRLHYVRKSRAVIQHEKDISEGLLLNILPASVAEELKAKGYADARQFEQATILFSDFADFTSLASTLTPAELVQEINTCFRAFDEITTTHGLEKIKTIGDAYMAASSIPETNEATAAHVVLAAIDMQAFINNRFTERTAQNLKAFQMRVGIHTGPVVAGIVGVKKFQYDIWGDTVNTASRLETNCEVRRINISDATYQLVRNLPNFTFTERGAIDVKGKGAMEMYYVDRK